MMNRETGFNDFFRTSMFFDCPFVSESRVQYSFVKKLGKDFFIEPLQKNKWNNLNLDIN